MSRIYFFYEEISFQLPAKKRLRTWIINTIRTEEKTAGEINFVFCTDAFLLEINKKYLNHSTLTDIVTFPVNHGFDATTSNKKSNAIEGEIYISIDRVKENALLFKASFIEELNRVMIHGVLHLCGYMDKNQEQKATMRLKENFYLDLLAKNKS